jgi:hypothetical protein
MGDWGVNFIQFINMNPLFKGTAVALLGALALLFAFWMRKRWTEPLEGGFLVFIALAIFVALYGLYILLFQPLWWKLPY